MLCSTAVCVHMLVRCARFDTRGSLSYVCVVPMGRDVITYVCMMAPQDFSWRPVHMFCTHRNDVGMCDTGCGLCVFILCVCVSSSCVCVGKDSFVFSMTQ